MGGHGGSLTVMGLECLVKALKAGPILLTHRDGPAGIFRAHLTVNRAGFRNMAASWCSRKREQLLSLSKKCMSRVLPPWRSLCKEIRGKGRRYGGTQADWCNAARHTSQILCVSLLLFSFPLCPTWRRFVMSAGWVDHPP